MQPESSQPPTADAFRDRFLFYLRYACGLELQVARAADHLTALELAVRGELIDRVIACRHAYAERRPKTVHYLSMEYLLGRLLRNNLIATGLFEVADEAMQSLGLSLETLIEEEGDPGLGNGGLGRLAACYLESLATLDYPARGYGLRYDYGMFRQAFENGAQVECPDTWLERGFAWELARPDHRVPVKVGGTVDWLAGDEGARRPSWKGWRVFHGVPYDVLVAGHRTDTVAVLRLWSAEAPADFDFQIFSQGDFLKAVAERTQAESITRVLYPADFVEAGRRLRLLQEYFLVACSVSDVITTFRSRHGEAWEMFPDKVAIQLNDTHPALTVAELMRFFLDEAEFSWQTAFDITRATCAFTNHTLLPEALETWPVALMEELIPRHVQIIYELNRRFLARVRADYGSSSEQLKRMAVLEEAAEPRFRMANLAIIGSHTTNGVAKLHTELLRKKVVRDFADLWPERFIAITNGITPRRWLLACNPRLAAAISRRIGSAWERDLDRLAELAPLADDAELQHEVLAIKRANKQDLVATLSYLCGVELDPDSLFDVQIKRLHEYKRQLLNLMHIILLYLRVKADPGVELVPRSFIFGAKAAPSYHMAKLVIRLINGVAEVINADPEVRGRLKVVFPPDYRVTLAEKIIPAADLSEQISTAGMEASGTGNMKLALNGALTIGTLDGANIEIRDAVGEDNIFIFGATADEVEQKLYSGGYDPWTFYRNDADLAAVIDALGDGVFAGGDRAALREIWSALMERGDRYVHLLDFASYVETQARVAALYQDPTRWARMAIANIAAMGYFSSDRAIHEYATRVWNLERVSVS